ncbi:Glycosyltransferase AglI [uncultured archaeon]|nr:Glycosyltransferase AglI [uncultured archaeon]
MDRRFDLASKYIRGQGIEIGALHQPLHVPTNVEVKYVDRLTNNDLLNHYPEVKESLKVSPDIIDDAETLDKIEDEIYDFCICNHVIEHMANPINAIMNWLRVLKTGGILYLSIPDISNPLDSGRDLTTMEHLINDNKERDQSEDFKHFLECAKYWTKSRDTNEIEKTARTNWDKHYSIHYHTFNKSLIERFFSYLIRLDDQFQIVESAENEINGVKEYIYIIEKTNYVSKIFDHLKISKQIIKQPRCDVIIPVYNAYFDFIKCLYSAMKYQNEYRIICIDDKSTDPRINELFLRIELSENDNVIMINNLANEGFVKTVNAGMEFSKKDVILLNSDTIITVNWAKKLSSCAYSDDNIATVTPLSNNATICSVPDFCKDNAVPEGFTIDDFADFIEKVSLEQYPVIPTAVGFCMYIKRKVIDEIGYFDDITFGKGYAEENDFCMRAIQAGYKNILCDDTFVFHKGAASFSGAQTELMGRNLKILSERYPDYFPDVAKFCQSNPLKLIQDNIKFRMTTWDNSAKKNLLFILHHLGGGTEHHVMDLIGSMKSSYICYILQIENNQMILTEFNNDRKLRYVFPMFHPTGFSVLYDEEYKNLFRRVVNTFHIGLIHIHQLILHTMDIFDIAQEQNIPLLMTFHDYYAVCPGINLLNEKYLYCHEKNDLEKCNICLLKHFSLPRNFIKEWRESFQKAINNCDLLIAPNPSVFKILKEYYDFPDDKTLVIEHGHKKELFGTNDILSDSDKNDRSDIFHIAYIGSLKRHKGNEIFYSLAQSKRLKNKVKWSIFGESDLHYAHGYNSKSNIHLYGKYKNLSELKYLLKKEKVDMVFLPSIWPETFSYTLSEAWAFGIPVLVSDMGALKERVERAGGGWIVDVSHLKNVEEKILEIIESKEDYRQKKDALKKINLKKMEEMQNEYNNVYFKYIHLANPAYSDEFILSNSEIFGSLNKTPDQLVPLIESHTNIFIRFYRCLREHGISYTLRKGYSYLNS